VTAVLWCIRTRVRVRCFSAFLIAVLVTLLLAAPAAANVRRWQWSLSKAMRKIDDRRIRIGSHVVRIDSETTLCSGVGRGVRRDGVRRWAEFRCTYSAFLAGGIYDCSFRLHVRGPRKYVITDARWIAGSP
jgi:hypothetical protein